MPKVLPFEELAENKFQLDTQIKISGYDCKIQVPAKLGKKIKDKRLKVTIEVIENE